MLQKLQVMQMQDEAGVNRLSIVSLDEIFSNTSPSVGAMACTQALGNLSRNISISSTHYQQFASLASQYPERVSESSRQY